ncbi:MAG TPA: hypothetical protein VF221_09040, partial [Chloroflexota bacterium]
LDRLGGAIIGVIQGLIVVELLVYLARHVPNAGMRHLTSHSALATAFLHVAPSFNHVFPHIPS